MQALFTAASPSALASEGEGTTLSTPWSRVKGKSKSISNRCHLFKLSFVWELTKQTTHLPLGCLQGGLEGVLPSPWREYSSQPRRRQRSRPREKVLPSYRKLDIRLPGKVNSNSYGAGPVC